jgi:hypothetical protein
MSPARVKSSKLEGEDCYTHTVGSFYDGSIRTCRGYSTLGSGTGPRYKYLRFEKLLCGGGTPRGWLFCRETQRWPDCQQHEDDCQQYKGDSHAVEKSASKSRSRNAGEQECRNAGMWEEAMQTRSPGCTFQPPACQDWVLVFNSSTLELPRHDDIKFYSGLHRHDLPAEEGFGLGLRDAIENLVSEEGRMIIGSHDMKTTAGSTCRHTRRCAAVTLQSDTRQPA